MLGAGFSWFRINCLIFGDFFVMKSDGELPIGTHHTESRSSRMADTVGTLLLKEDVTAMQTSHTNSRQALNTRHLPVSFWQSGLRIVN